MLKPAIQNVCKEILTTDCVPAGHTTLGHVIFYSILAVYGLSLSFVHVSLHLRVYVLDEDVNMVIRVKKVSLRVSCYVVVNRVNRLRNRWPALKRVRL